MKYRVFFLGLLTSLFSGCAMVERVEEAIEAAVKPDSASQAAPGARFASGKDLGVYKERVAQKIVASSNSKTFAGELPPMLKSVVILDITLDKNGDATRVAVMRSNGFKELERTAIDSVKRAELPAPASNLLSGGQLRYLETWLFRDDGKFQIRSLVREPQPGAEKLG